MNRTLLNALSFCTCAATTVKYSMEALIEEGFEELALSETFELKRGGKYFINVFDTTLIAFVVGKDIKDLKDIRLLAAHTDSPAFSIKPNPQLKTGKYGKLNVEVYGGPILNTWLDRPLSVAGKVCVKSDKVFKPQIKIVDFMRPIMLIPNLAIHMNRDVNKGVELNKQTHLLPLVTMMNETADEEFFMDMLSKELGVVKEDILDYELFAYCCNEPFYVGKEAEFILAPRIDNIVSVYSCLEAITADANDEALNIIALFDNEEVGSITKQGADSTLMKNVIQKIAKAFAFNEAEAYGIAISMDVAHASHPNYMDKSDVTNIVNINDGVVIKKAANQGYATDCYLTGIITEICRANDIKYQYYVNRSDIAGGRTLGSILSSNFILRTIDIGVPVLGMHSACETVGVDDVNYATELAKNIFQMKKGD